jgi:hypothetical protein
MNDLERARFLSMIEKQREGLQEPWIDPTAAASGGFSEGEPVDIQPGDWVTINKNYAKEHGVSQLHGKYTILKKTVKASEIATDGNSIHEWGYHPKE